MIHLLSGRMDTRNYSTSMNTSISNTPTYNSPLKKKRTANWLFLMYKSLGVLMD